MVALRVMGKREIGQLSIFDFVVSIMIAELSTLPMEDTDVPLYRSFLAIGLLVVLQTLVALLQLHSHRFRHIVEGEPEVLVEHGRIKEQNLRKTRYSMHDLLMQIREQGIASVADVEFAILETSGKLSVFPRTERRPLTLEDVGLRGQPHAIPMPLVIDGEPVAKTLRELGRDTAWLEAELNRRGYRLTEVFYAAVDRDGSIHIDARDEAAQDGDKGSGAGSGASCGPRGAVSHGKRQPPDDRGQPGADARDAADGRRRDDAE
ncbi:MAG: DUF421 domain-containing protein [Alicyclobacillaceae bacterium]|nr:DUF421 domain-containing protein [Alicyclobacillaceae bacterium]